MSKKIIITGVTGQFGSFMVEYLLQNTDHEIYGMVRRLSVRNHKNIAHLKSNPRFKLFSGDLTDGHSLTKAIEEIRPDYFINAAAQSFVAESWISPVNTFVTDAVSIIHILEAIRKIVPYCRFANMGSSEQFGDVKYSPQDIHHPFRSRSPYAAAKVAAHQIVKVYRESYGLYAIQPVCFNYEGTRRGEEFVTRKITKGVARIYHAIKNNSVVEPIELGSLDSKRDWSDCEDYVDGVWRMLNQEIYNPLLQKIPYSQGSILLPFVVETENAKALSKHIKEYVLASGEVHSVKEFVELSFKKVGIKGSWCGNGPDEYFWYSSGPAPLPSNECKLVIVNPKFYRPADVELLIGDSTPIRQELGWSPKTNFESLVEKMVNHDVETYEIT